MSNKTKSKKEKTTEEIFTNSSVVNSEIETPKIEGVSLEEIGAPEYSMNEDNIGHTILTIMDQLERGHVLFQSTHPNGHPSIEDKVGKVNGHISRICKRLESCGAMKRGKVGKRVFLTNNGKDLRDNLSLWNTYRASLKSFNSDVMDASFIQANPDHIETI